MKLKELIGKFDYKEIFEFITKYGRENADTLAGQIGPFSNDDFGIFLRTYDLLTGKTPQPADSGIADKYLVRIYGTYARVKYPKGAPRSRNRKMEVVPYCGIYDKTADRHDPISSEYVKNISDFAECEIEMVDTLPELKTASVAVLSFMVVDGEFIEIYGEGCAEDYVLYCYNFVFKPER